MEVEGGFSGVCPTDGVFNWEREVTLGLVECRGGELLPSVASVSSTTPSPPWMTERVVRSRSA